MKEKILKVLALSTYPTDAAATRFRIAQFKSFLLDRGVEVELHSFLTSEQFRMLYSSKDIASKIASLTSSLIKRFALATATRQFDLILIQREAMFFGPAFFEWLYSRIGDLPIVLDLDDATYVAYESPTYGKIGSLLKFFGKTDRLIDRADLVICGNRFIEEYVRNRGKKAIVIPTIVDTNVFLPVETKNDIPVVGWIGTHSTFQFLRSMLPVITELAKKHEFVLRVIGAGVAEIDLPGVKVENLAWKLEREVEDFQSFDIGLYPIEGADNLDVAWLAGKSGFKAIQYFAVGLPFVMTPVGVSAEMGEPGITHFNARTHDEWFDALDKLLSDDVLRRKMGTAGREHSLATYSLEHYSSVLARALLDVKDKAKSATKKAAN